MYFLLMQANILHLHHKCDVVILMHQRHGRGSTVTCYGTEGTYMIYKLKALYAIGENVHTDIKLSLNF